MFGVEVARIYGVVIHVELAVVAGLRLDFYVRENFFEFRGDLDGKGQVGEE